MTKFSLIFALIIWLITNAQAIRCSYCKESINNQFKTLSWEIRKWTPTAQSVYNSFYWNYPDYLNKTILLINIGERNSTISGLQNSSLQVTDELRIGIQNLNDALSDQGVSIEKWSDRSSFQVPRSFILAVGKKVDQGLYDNIFTPVFSPMKCSKY